MMNSQIQSTLSYHKQQPNAFQVGRGKLPEWFLDSIDEGKSIITSSKSASVSTTEGFKIAKHKDWIMKMPNGDLRVIPYVKPCVDKDAMVTHSNIKSFN